MTKNSIPVNRASAFVGLGPVTFDQLRVAFTEVHPPRSRDNRRRHTIFKPNTPFRLDWEPARLFNTRFQPQAQVAQSVEQRTENPRVGGSIPPLGTI